MREMLCNRVIIFGFLVGCKALVVVLSGILDTFESYIIISVEDSIFFFFFDIKLTNGGVSI